MKDGAPYIKQEVPQTFIDMMEDDCDFQDYQAELIHRAFLACLKRYNNIILCEDCGKILQVDRPVKYNTDLKSDDCREGEMHSVDLCIKCYLVHCDAGQAMFDRKHYFGHNTRGEEEGGCAQCGETHGGELSSGHCSSCYNPGVSI